MSNSSDPLLTAAGGPAFAPAQIVAILRKRLWLIAAIAVAVPALVGLVVSKQPKEFEARATLVIDSSAPQYLGQGFRDVVDPGTSWWNSQETMQTELRIIGSLSQALAVAQALCTPHGGDPTLPMARLDPTIHCNNTKELDHAAVMLQTMLRLEPIKDSRIVSLMVTHHDAAMSALLANTMAQVYVQRNLERRLTQSTGAANWLGDEYGDLTQQLNDAERQLIDFKRKNNVVSVGIEDQQNDLATRHKKLSDELSTVQVRLIALNAQRQQYSQIGSEDPLNDVSPGVSDSPVMMKLKEMFVEQTAKLIEMKGKYLEKHPAVMAQQARVEEVRSDLRREAQLANRNVEAQYRTLIKQEKDLRSALDGVTHEALQLEQRAIDYNRLKRNFDRLAKLSDQVGGRERETSLAGHLKTNNVSILDPATVPSTAVAPNLPRAVGGAIAFALLLGFGLAFLLEILDATVKTQEDVEKTLGLSFLGLIPTIQPDAKAADVPAPKALEDAVRKGSRDLYVLTHPKSSVAECCRSIRTNLLFMTPDRPARTMLITSAGPQEGKTTTAINMAITMAQSGLRVLLVDTDMRRPRLHKAFGVPATGNGLSKSIVGGAEVMSLVCETGVPNMWLLPCGATPPNPAELLHAERFKRIISELSAGFDRVIFDSPPVGAVTDAAILARLVDGVVLVAKSGHTSRDALRRARGQLGEGANINVLGCILNDLDLSKHRSYGYYYYAKYGSYYGDDAKAAKESSGG